MRIARIGERYAGARDALDWPRALSQFGTKRGIVAAAGCSFGIPSWV